MPKDYYIILGVSKNAELSKIKKAYRKAVKRYHPDLKDDYVVCASRGESTRVAAQKMAEVHGNRTHRPHG